MSPSRIDALIDPLDRIEAILAEVSRAIVSPEHQRQRSDEDLRAYRDLVRERAALRSLVRRALRAEIDGTWIDEAMRLVGPGGKLEQAIADAIATGQGPGGVA
jgi:hypothetical protein